MLDHRGCGGEVDEPPHLRALRRGARAARRARRARAVGAQERHPLRRRHGGWHRLKLPRRVSQHVGHASSPDLRRAGRRRAARGCGDEVGAPGAQGGAAAGPRTIATGLAMPWSIAFLPGGDALGERARQGPDRAESPRRAQARGDEGPGVAPVGEGGLLGLAVSPHYAAGPARVRVLHQRHRQPHRSLPADGGEAHAVLTGRARARSTTAGGSPSGRTGSSTPGSVSRHGLRPGPDGAATARSCG